jgi:alpha/beta superfamily hydrolase
MTQTATQRSFDGPFKNELNDLANLIDWLQAEHDKSFVKAGDDKVYAFGGAGYVLVVDQSLWDGLIELITPSGGLSIKPGENGQIAITGSPDDSEKTLRERLREGVAEIRKYYENRYWSTPKTSA